MIQGMDQQQYLAKEYKGESDSVSMIELYCVCELISTRLHHMRNEKKKQKEMIVENITLEKDHQLAEES